jgi:murein DD-endopeptidase MepM/ murein hydrolase activator NlpD
MPRYAVLLGLGASLLAAVMPPALAMDLKPGATAATPAGVNRAASNVEIVVGKDDTLADILVGQGISPSSRRAVLKAISDVFDPASLQIGARLRLTLAPEDPLANAATSPSHVVQAIELTSGETVALTIHVDADSGLAANASTVPLPAASVPASTQVASRPAEDGQFVVRHVAGIVGPNFRRTLQAVKLPPSLIDEIALGFKADPAQHATLPQTAAFDVIYEGVLRDGKFDDPQLRYATVNDGGKVRRIYRYQTDDATTALMRADGQGVALIDLGRPLQIDARITSPFGWRIHPVFGDRRFHEGVDFGAPTGTPVVAACDGVIEDIGWRGNYGDYIRLRHDGHVATAYAHLSSFARGLRRGSPVKRGDVIAYVGRSGVATGPHLYYEVLVDGKQIDPMKTPPAVPVSLTGTQLAEFRKFVETAAEE